MEEITFENTHQSGEVVFENDLYIHIHHPEMLLSYDNNYIKFKSNPSVAEFTETEQYLRSFHLKYGQKHVKFNFPENEKLTPELINLLIAANYNIGLLELYTIQPNQFPAVKGNPEITIQPVSDINLDTYLEFQFEQDLKFGYGYAEQRQVQHERNFRNEKILQLIAYFQGFPAGSADVIITNGTAEIAEFIVRETFQKKGIGSRLQKYVMDQFFDKAVILVANGEDTARDMYRRQNYQYLGYKIEVMKVNE